MAQPTTPRFTYVDDSDPRISYSSGWGTWTSTSGANGHSTTIVGSTARFSFFGHQVIVYGYIPEGPSDEETTVGFALDGGTSRSIPVAADSSEFERMWWVGGGLELDDHSLIVTYLGGSEFRLSQIRFDDFIMRSRPSSSTDQENPAGNPPSSNNNPSSPTGGADSNSTPNDSNSSSSPPHTSTGRSSQYNTLLGGQPSQPPSNSSGGGNTATATRFYTVSDGAPTPSSAENVSQGNAINQVPIGSIIGGTVGGLLAILLLALCALLLKRWLARREESQKLNNQAPVASPTTYTNTITTSGSPPPSLVHYHSTPAYTDSTSYHPNSYTTANSHSGSSDLPDDTLNQTAPLPERDAMWTFSNTLSPPAYPASALGMFASPLSPNAQRAPPPAYSLQ